MKKLYLVTAIILIPSQVLFSGCATVLQHGPDMIMVNTSPDGATVYLDEIPVGKTPMTVPVDRASDGIFKIEKDGYKTIMIDRDKVLAGWFFPGNLLWLLLWPGLPVAIIVDLASSNQGKYQTTPINLKLEEGPGSEIRQPIE